MPFSVLARWSINETLAYPRVSADRFCFSATLASFSRATARIDHFPIGKYIFVLYIGLFVGFFRVSRLIHRSSPRSCKAIARALNSECQIHQILYAFSIIQGIFLAIQSTRAIIITITNSAIIRFLKLYIVYYGSVMTILYLWYGKLITFRYTFSSYCFTIVKFFVFIRVKVEIHSSPINNMYICIYDAYVHVFTARHVSLSRIHAP